MKNKAPAELIAAVPDHQGVLFRMPGGVDLFALSSGLFLIVVVKSVVNGGNILIIITESYEKIIHGKSLFPEKVWVKGAGQKCQDKKMAPALGLEPRTKWLTVKSYIVEN